LANPSIKAILSKLSLSLSLSDSLFDLRRGVVFTILDTVTTLSRNEQFESFSNTFRQHQLVESVVINEYYLPGDEQEVYVGHLVTLTLYLKTCVMRVYVCMVILADGLMCV
jgi:hypothetical protein